MKRNAQHQEQIQAACSEFPLDNFHKISSDDSTINAEEVSFTCSWKSTFFVWKLYFFILAGAA